MFFLLAHLCVNNSYLIFFPFMHLRLFLMIVFIKSSQAQNMAKTNAMFTQPQSPNTHESTK